MRFNFHHTYRCRYCQVNDILIRSEYLVLYYSGLFQLLFVRIYASFGDFSESVVFLDIPKYKISKG